MDEKKQRRESSFDPEEGWSGGGDTPLLVENGPGVNRFRSLAGVYRDRTSGGEV